MPLSPQEAQQKQQDTIKRITKAHTVKIDEMLGEGGRDYRIPCVSEEIVDELVYVYTQVGWNVYRNHDMLRFAVKD
jgi:hypothetical protein